MSHYNETELLTRIAAGDQLAYDHIFRLFYKPLCFFAYKILLDQAKAEDLVQDGLLKLWQRRGDFESINKVKSFLYVSVRNACFDDIEHQKVIGRHRDELHRTAGPSDENILEVLMQAEVVASVFSMVNTLPDQCRKVIRMTFEEGKTPKQIADELGITVSTVSNQKMRGLILLKKRLSEKDVTLAICLLLPELHKIMR